MTMLTWLLADAVHDKERLFSEWRGPLVALAVGGFVIGVIGHLVRSRTAIVTGIMLVCVALVLFPIFLWVRGTP